jgi:hypothetical protein
VEAKDESETSFEQLLQGLCEVTLKVPVTQTAKKK